MFGWHTGANPRATLQRRHFLAGLATISFGTWARPAAALSLRGTLWDEVGQETGCDPHLLYAVALIESAAGSQPGWVVPHPLAIRAPQRPYYPSNLNDARQVIQNLKRSNELTHSAVGMMQIFVRWHRKRFGDVEELLDARKNVRVGAEILVEALQSAPNDRVLGIGRYHTWAQEPVARQYGASVVALWRQLRALA